MELSRRALLSSSSGTVGSDCAIRQGLHLGIPGHCSPAHLARRPSGPEWTPTHWLWMPMALSLCPPCMMLPFVRSLMGFNASVPPPLAP